MKKGILLLISTFLTINLYAQNVDSVWIKKHYIKKEQYIRMRDGIRLFTATYIPTDAGEKHPFLMLRTPYSSAPYGRDNWMPFWKTYFKQYVKEGYCIVIQDVRGKYMSEGAFVDIRPFNPNKKTNKDIDEASDTYDTIDWLLKNVANNNGKVGVLGTSYPGFYAAMAALSGHPALKAVSPQAPVTDWFMGDDFHHNGAFFLQDGFGFYVAGGFGAPRPQPTIISGRGIKLNANNSYTYYLQKGALSNFTALASDSIAFWNELMQHPNLDNWWQARNDRQYADRINPGTATLVVGGLFDAEDAYGTWHLYRAIETKAKNNNKLVIGPWYHGQWGGSSPGNKLGAIKFGSNTADFYKQNIEIPFFNYYLKGKGNIDTLAEATVFFSGENKWRRFKKWPSADEKPLSLYLNSNHTLKYSTPASGYDSYINDPANPVPYTTGVHSDRTKEYMVDDQRFAAKRKDVLVYSTPLLDKDITLGGPLTADLWTSISTTDADFVIKLIDVYPGGNKKDTVMNNYQMMVRGDIFRGRFRKSFSKPEAFTPGKVTEVKFTTNDVAHTFKKGHRIMVQVQSSWFPLVDRNPQQFVNIYKAGNKDFIKSTINIWHSKVYASRVILPVIP